MFDNKHYISRGVNTTIPPLLQIIMWELIRTMPVSSKDYLQVFSLSESGGKQRILHTQEEPYYKREYLLNLGTAVNGKIFVIDDTTHSTMIMNYEY